MGIPIRYIGLKPRGARVLRDPDFKLYSWDVKHRPMLMVENEQWARDLLTNSPALPKEQRSKKPQFVIEMEGRQMTLEEFEASRPEERAKRVFPCKFDCGHGPFSNPRALGLHYVESHAGM